MPARDAVSYLALGDSYTIGTGAATSARAFPALLVSKLEAQLRMPVRLTNPAVNGYTTADLIREELPLLRSRADLVSVLIGANDVVQGWPLARYRNNLAAIYEAVLTAGVPGPAVLTVSVPDWSSTPAAGQFGAPAAIRARLDAVNAVARQEAEERGMLFADVVPISRRTEPGWLSDDSLHPSEAQYAAWAQAIWAAQGERWAAAVAR
ncbi:MAG: SGNH/GDSL hydrolase family protein [Candidatus Dormibacteraeota bacterium]|uniref:SGNH/GDSL hydrolase family protein n=1 Tax=Candidatus Dormiibacter inghamiae TaxID=3127013 RepID=A0A934NCF9_9BACT|nr:SGNH/GDSL hydrolase family protein [Candidatus Dormibacteraeota bacterium]MBJ7606741.1 SGNH/GDSL hydrolase family protein [Candidatus Dormibacteraeota bacterium]